MSDTDNNDREPGPQVIEAEIVETREHLAGAIEELAAKLDVKGQAQAKVEETKSDVKDKVVETKERIQQKVGQLKDAAQDKLAGTKDAAQEKLAGTKDAAQDKIDQLRGHPSESTEPVAEALVADALDEPSPVLDHDRGRTAQIADQAVVQARRLFARFRGASRPVQGVVVGAPLALAVLFLVRSARA